MSKIKKSLSNLWYYIKYTIIIFFYRLKLWIKRLYLTYFKSSYLNGSIRYHEAWLRRINKDYKIVILEKFCNGLQVKFDGSGWEVCECPKTAIELKIPEYMNHNGEAVIEGINRRNEYIFICYKQKNIIFLLMYAGIISLGITKVCEYILSII